MKLLLDNKRRNQTRINDGGIVEVSSAPRKLDEHVKDQTFYVEIKRWVLKKGCMIESKDTLKRA